MTLQDGRNNVIARRPFSTTEGQNIHDRQVQFTANLTASPWSVVLDVPLLVYLRPLIAAFAALVLTILVVVSISILGGRLASRRLTRAIDPRPRTRRPLISGIRVGS